MESRELRIGNILREKHTGDNLVVLELTNDRITFDYQTFTTWQAEPIPLTEEILLKCGYFLENINSKSYGGKNLTQLYKCDIGYRMPFGNKIEYLHELQNRHFSLWNTELEIKL